jgi:type II secretory pathway predicted ATPase ExeA
MGDNRGPRQLGCWGGTRALKQDRRQTMVLDYYQLQEQPFGVTPDSRYLFLNSTYKEALSSLIYAVESGCGFVALIAAPGMGKTTLLFRLKELLKEKTRTVFLFQTISTPLDLLRALLSGLGVRELNGGLVDMQIKLKDLLHQQSRQGKRVVLVIDEAQNLDASVLELVRMLSNFETQDEKLIQIILAGQPQLADTIGSPEMLQLRQRISIFARLKPLSPEEVSQYIASRLKVAGYGSSLPLFTKDAITQIAQWSEGIPRNINNLCFNALSLGCAMQQKLIDREVLRQVITDLDLGPLSRTPSTKPPLATPVEEKSIPVETQSSSEASTPSMFSGHAAKRASVFAVGRSRVALGLLAAVVAGAALVGAYRWLSAPADPSSGASVQQATAPATPAQAPANVAQPESNVVVQPPPASKPTPARSSATPGPAAIPALGMSGPPADAANLVTVRPGQTVVGICVNKFGNCTAQILQQIRDLNPTLGNNFDHIEIGQTLRLPVVQGQPATGQQPRTTPAGNRSHE